MATTDLRITSAMMDATLLDLPWDLPLDEWPEDTVVSLPKGISRHLVRFARLGSSRRRHGGAQEFSNIRQRGT